MHTSMVINYPPSWELAMDTVVARYAFMQGAFYKGSIHRQYVGQIGISMAILNSMTLVHLAHQTRQMEKPLIQIHIYNRNVLC
jgi:hypothetical protein